MCFIATKNVDAKFAPFFIEFFFFYKVHGCQFYDKEKTCAGERLTEQQITLSDQARPESYDVAALNVAGCFSGFTLTLITINFVLFHVDVFGHDVWVVISRPIVT
jgi:hypothetical protein